MPISIQFDRDTESYKFINHSLNITSLPEFIRVRIYPQPCKKEGVAGDCWKWGGPLYNGYGKVSYKGHRGPAHRVVYELLVGRIPAGLEIDHLCYNRACVNPAHLEPVTRLENIRRSHITGTGNGTRTHCRKGHELVPFNVYRWRGKRFCLKCQAIRQTAYNKRKAKKASAA